MTIKIPNNSLKLILFLVLLPVNLFAQTKMETAEQILDRTAGAAKAGDKTFAIAIADSLVKVHPDMASAWWMLGEFQLNNQKPELAIRPLNRYRELRPDDWRVLPELIQAYQFIRDTANRDKERADLFRLYNEGKDSSLTSQTEYELDVFYVDTSLVEVFEQLNPKGDRPEFIYFYWFDSKGMQVGRFSLGSYESDNAYARQRGELKADERIYTFDYNTEKSHATFGYFKSNPMYDTLRKMVVAIIRGELEPFSNSKFRY
jgi:hypothetical protein